MQPLPYIMQKAYTYKRVVDWIDTSGAELISFLFFSKKKYEVPN